jgi:hypothetical protein
VGCFLGGLTCRAWPAPNVSGLTVPVWKNQGELHVRPGPWFPLIGPSRPAKTIGWCGLRKRTHHAGRCAVGPWNGGKKSLFRAQPNDFALSRADGTGVGRASRSVGDQRHLPRRREHRAGAGTKNLAGDRWDTAELDRTLRSLDRAPTFCARAHGQ